jgi:uncharacterized protein YdiU (UPF0061 family)
MFYRRHRPAAVRRPELVLFNRDLAGSLGLSADSDEDTAALLSGNELPPGAQPICQAYAGYQFGRFAMLGDGRAVLLGEQAAPDGRRFDVQLKGSGRTPFSRGGDGLAALGPMLREYIIGEAMHCLGIPTTRALAVVLTGETVRRERALPGAVLTRVASSHIRVGTFNYASAFGGTEDIRALADYSIARHYPWLSDTPDKYPRFLLESVRRQASLIAKWQSAGFVHGVMNTDNMTVSGETIDYGPCAFMDAYDPDAVFSSIDTAGRYAYGKQPAMGAWNLARFAESLLPLWDGSINDILAEYWRCFREEWRSVMQAKAGSRDVEGLLDGMARNRLDFTGTFRALSADNPAVIPRNHRVEEALAAAEEGDYSVVKRLLEALSKPYEDSEHYGRPPETPSCYRTFCGT